MLAYLHIPFCDSKCFYCSFNSYTNLHDRINAYMNAINTQLISDLNRYSIEKNSLETLFIGGGTPSCIKPKFYKKFFEILKPYLKKDAEITTEANPNSANIEWLKGMQELGVNRISFGVQSFDDKKLQALNRAHSAKEAIDAVLNAKKVGFENISLDIIYDFYTDTKELIQKDLETALSLPINHISSYELTIEKATHFSKEPQVKANFESLGFFLRDFIVQNALEQYEVSNYGTYKSRHNIGYWQHKEYLGIGAGAVGYIAKSRLYPHTNIDHYIKEPTYKREEQLSSSDILTEQIFLGLRSNVGIKRTILTPQMQKQAYILLKEQKLTMQNGTFYNKEYFLSDELALFIMQN